MKSNTQKVIVFTDEKNWPVDKHHKCRNTRYIGKSKENVDPSVKYCPRFKFPAKAMSFGLVTSDSFTITLLCIDGTLNSSKHVLLLEKNVIPALDSNNGRGNYVS